MLTDAQGINDRGQIIAQGTFRGSERGFLLNPTFDVVYGGNNINVGNISTFGDTVLLQGGKINLTGEAIATRGGKITFDGATTVSNNLTINSSVAKNTTAGGDITFSSTLDGTSAGGQNLTLKAGAGDILFGDTVGGNTTFNNINVLGANAVTANADITSSNLIKINAKEDITAKNVTSENGSVLLTSKEKSITTEDITTKGKNIVLKAIEGIDAANLNAGELGVVQITSGDIVKNDTKTLEDDTILVGNVSTESITGKKVRIVGSGSFTATGDITAHNGKIEVAVINDINTKNISSLAKSINLISTEGAVTVDGDLDSKKGGIAIHAADDLTTQKISSADGVIALSSSQGAITVEDDINTVRGGVIIGAKGNVQVTNITTGIGEVSLGSGQNIVASGNIATNVGYVNLKAGGSLNIQDVTTSRGYISIGADGSVNLGSLATTLGAVNLVSATSSVVVNGGINTNGSRVAIEASAEIITNPSETNVNKDDFVAFSDFGGYGTTLIASGGVTDAGSTVIESLEDLSSEQERLFSEIIDELLYYSKPVGEFLIGALYQTVANNSEDAINIGQFFLQYPLKLTERDKKYWTQIIEGQSKAFQLGRELGNAASIVQGIIETVSGAGTFVGGSALCTVGAGATFGISCAAGAPAMAAGAIISAHGLSVIKNGLENDTDANLIDDLLSPVKMESNGGADGIRGLSKETGISQGSISNVYKDLSSGDIKLLGDKLNKNNVETLFNKGDQGGTGSELVKNVSKIVNIFAKDADAISDVKQTLSKNQIKPDGTQIIDDNQLKTAFSNTIEF
ncbi:MAG: hypothetical protein HC930_05030 [Hydrococcus sp. SU_1_0]|nr:hypothetical protein [Hydrococcus sp. SU_1_0]